MMNVDRPLFEVGGVCTALDMKCPTSERADVLNPAAAAALLMKSRLVGAIRPLRPLSRMRVPYHVKTARSQANTVFRRLLPDLSATTEVQVLVCRLIAKVPPST